MADENEPLRRRRKPSVNVRDLKKVIDMMRKAELSELDIEQEGLTLRLRRGAEPIVYSAPAPTAPPAPVAPPAPAAVALGIPAETAPVLSEVEEVGSQITSPMVGTFYTAASPEADPFVKEGSSVAVGDTLCIIEAMKLMNEIKAEATGTIVRVLIENAQPVEYGQPLFSIKPA